MSNLLAKLRDRVAAIADPTASRLRGEALAALLKTKATAWALDAFRADSAWVEESRRRDEHTRSVVAARRAAEIAEAKDRGLALPAAEDDAQTAEWRSHLAWLDAEAAALGLQARGWLVPHLADRRRVLVAHLEERFKSEGAPVELAELRAELSRLIASGWKLQARWRELQKENAGLGGSIAPGGEEREAEIVRIYAELAEHGRAEAVLRRRLSFEYGIDR